MSDPDILTLIPKAPYDFGAAARFFSSRSTLPVGIGNVTELPDGRHKLTTFARLNGHVSRVSIQSVGTISNPKLTVATEDLQQRPESNPLAEGFVRRVFSLNASLRPFYKVLKSDRHICAVHTKLRGVKPVLTPTPFEAVVWAVLGQQISLSFARQLKHSVTERYGEPVTWGAHKFHLHPGPEALSKARLATLRSMKLSENKAHYLVGLSKAIVEGDIQFTALSQMPIEDAVKELLKFRGIGPWTAAYILMRGIGHLDALTIGDAGLRRAVHRAYRLRSAPDDAKLEKIAERYRPYRSLWTLYMWQAYA